MTSETGPVNFGLSPHAVRTNVSASMVRWGVNTRPRLVIRGRPFGTGFTGTKTDIDSLVKDSEFRSVVILLAFVYMNYIH